MHRHDDPVRQPNLESAPRVLPGEIAVLRVSDINETGVFLDQDTDKELLLPHNEVHGRVWVGDEVVVKVLEDARGRAYATNQLTRHLDFAPRGLGPGMEVAALVYGHHERGFLCVVNGRHSGMLYLDRTHRPLQVTDAVQAFITHIYPTGKLDLSLTPPGVDPFTAARATIVDRLRADGFLPVHDKSPPSLIRSQLGMSKKAFKRAVGALYRERRDRKSVV